MRKKASLIIDLRDGVNLPKVADLTAVLAAAGWKVDLALKEYGGESQQLAKKASVKGYDVIIAYGGDGTLNQVVNGVMNTKGNSAVGIIPGGTANEWATESGVPLEPFHAALALVNSEPREVDLGYMNAQGLVFPEAAQSSTNAQGSSSPQAAQSSTTGASSGSSPKAKKKKTPNAKNRFLLMAGLGLDAGVISYVSKSLKYRVGELAYAPAAVKDLPEAHPFPVELRQVTDTGETLLWQGDAWQVIFGNTRLYGGLVELTPQAYIDDGQLDVCIIKSGNILTTATEIASLLFQRKSAPADTENFRAARFSIRVPASIGAHLDGSVIELKDYLGKADQQRLAQAGDPTKVMVEYTFAAEPAAIHMTIPRTYSGALFSKTPAAAPSQAAPTPAQQPSSSANAPVQPETAEQVNALVAQGTKVSVVGVGPIADKQNTYIIAGTTQNEKTGDTSPIAVRVNDKTAILQHTGEIATLAAVQALQEGAEVVVDGKKNKRGALKAAHLVL